MSDAFGPIIDFIQNRDPSRFDVVAQQGFEPDVSSVEAFETDIGFALPDDFRAFLVHPLGGLYVAAKEDIWPRPEMFAVGPFWSFCYAFYVYGLSPEVPDFMNLKQAWQDMQHIGCGHLVPFARVEGDADAYCFTKEQKVVRWQHDDIESPEPVEETFVELVRRELDELDDRIDRKLAESNSNDGEET